MTKKTDGLHRLFFCYHCARCLFYQSEFLIYKGLHFPEFIAAENHSVPSPINSLPAPDLRYRSMIAALALRPSPALF
jgi:hypothetical protein